jgi:hypothetical protein
LGATPELLMVSVVQAARLLLAREQGAACTTSSKPDGAPLFGESLMNDPTSRPQAPAVLTGLRLRAVAALRYVVSRLDPRRLARPRPAPPRPWLRLDNEELWTTVAIWHKDF